MKTKHIQYRSALFIGLLSLNTLSSCVNATRRLGGGSSSRDTEQGNNTNRSKKENSNWKKQAVYGATAAGLAAASGIFGHQKGYSSGYDQGVSDGKSGCFNNSQNSQGKGKMDFPDPYRKK